MSAAAARGLQFDYPPLEGVTADLLLVTHEHSDHNAVEVVGGDPVLIRSSAGTFATRRSARSSASRPSTTRSPARSAART